MEKEKKPMGFGDDGVVGSGKKLVTILLFSMMGFLFVIYKILKSKTGKSE